MENYSYRPSRMVCCNKIDFDLENGKLHNVHFTGGCNGNLKAIGRLLEGQDAAWAVETLRGNDCGGRGTSCADQLAIAVEDAMKSKQQ